MSETPHTTNNTTDNAPSLGNDGENSMNVNALEAAIADLEAKHEDEYLVKLAALDDEEQQILDNANAVSSPLLDTSTLLVDSVIVIVIDQLTKHLPFFL